MQEVKKSDKLEMLCEKHLYKLDANLHNRFKNSIFAIDRLLANYKMVFPFYTDHTLEHSEQVIRYSNYFIGDKNVEKLNADELYILLMGACLHDVGMGISENDFNNFKNKIKGLDEYIKENPDKIIGDYTRAFHQEFSACFIEKYKDLFEIPSDEYLYCICQVARGHRKYNLLDEEEFPRYFKLENGNTVRLPYLAAVVKAADEMDIANERNLLIDYDDYTSGDDKVRAMCFRAHEAVKKIDFEDDINVYYSSDEKDVLDEIKNIEEKVNSTYNEAKAVVEEYEEFENVYNNIVFFKQ